MLEAGEENGVIRIRASGTLESSDFDRFVPLFEHIAAREPRSAPMLIELAPDFSGWDLGGLWRDLKFDVKHRNKFGRIAIVGDKTWQEWGTKLTDPFFLRPTCAISIQLKSTPLRRGRALAGKTIQHDRRRSRSWLA